MSKKIFVLIFLNLIFISVSYSVQWKTVRIGGGGYVTSMKAHTQVKNLYFITTDVGTPYRWNADKECWEGLLYNLPSSDWNRGAVGDIAFDPNDKKGIILFATLSSDKNVNGTVLKSTDRGDTWVDCKIPIEVWPNSHKGIKRLAVDPQNSQIVYVTTCYSKEKTLINGTFVSRKAGEPGTWEKLNDLCGDFIEFDLRAGKVNGLSKHIFMGCADGVYQSVDGGKSFQKMLNSPKKPQRSSIHKDGTLYVTDSSGVYTFKANNWKNITPPTPGNYRAIAVNPHNSKQVVCCSNTKNPYRFNAYRSKDGGKTWEKMQLDSAAVVDNSEVPWFITAVGQNLSEFCWDPFDRKMVWFTDFFNATQTQNIWSEPYPVWKPRAVGEEETVATGTILCPPSGSNLLLTSIADAGGWDHRSLTEPPKVGMQKFFPWKLDPVKKGFDGWGNISGIAIQETNPDFIVRVGRVGWIGSGYAGYSANGGESYTLFNIPKDVAGGRVAVSATNETIVWVPQTGLPQRSVNRGMSWDTIKTLPKGIIAGDNIFASGPVFPLAADKVNGKKFYVYNNEGGMFVSNDGGISFTLLGKGLPTARPARNLTVETTSGLEGDIWVGCIDSGLYHSTDSGVSFKKIEGIETAEFITLGKSAVQSPEYPAIYVLGTMKNTSRRLFRSNDNGISWEDLGEPKIGKNPLCMSADKRVYGRVFIGTGGNGYFYGEGL